MTALRFLQSENRFFFKSEDVLFPLRDKKFIYFSLDFENILNDFFLHLRQCLIFLCDTLCNPTATFLTFKEGTKVKGGLHIISKQVVGIEGLKGLEKTWRGGNPVCLTLQGQKWGG